MLGVRVGSLLMLVVGFGVVVITVGVDVGFDVSLLLVGCDEGFKYIAGNNVGCKVNRFVAETVGVTLGAILGILNLNGR